MVTSDRIASIPDTNTARKAQSNVPNFGTDYVASGGRFTPNYDSDVLAVGSAVLFISEGDRLYHVEVDSRGEPGDLVSLASGATNDIYYSVDQEAIVATTGTAPSGPSLRIGTVDTASQTHDDTVNRDRSDTFRNLESDSVNTGKQTFDGVAIGRQADGTLQSYDSIDAACTDGNRYVGVLADEVDEVGITIPQTDFNSSFTLEGIGETTINAPTNTDTPMLDAEVSSGDSRNVTIKNLQFRSDNGAGPLLSANFHEAGNLAHRWRLENVSGKFVGPIVFLGVDEPQFNFVHNQSMNETTVTFNGTDYTVGAGLIHKGQSSQIIGGDFANQSGSGPYGLRLINCRNATLYQTQAKHDDGEGTGVAMVSVEGGDNNSLEKVMTSGVATNAPNDVVVEQGITTNRPGNTEINGLGSGPGNIVLDEGVDGATIRKPQGASVNIEARDAFYIEAIGGEAEITKSGSTSQNVLIRGGPANDETPQSGGTFEIAKGEFQTQEDGKGLIVRSPDGTQYRIRAANDGSVTTDAL